MTVACPNVPASELDMYPPPVGIVESWQPDARTRPATTVEHVERKCRRPRCGGAPVMALERSNGWWLYCAAHMYGRRIRDGIVEHRRWDREP